MASPVKVGFMGYGGSTKIFHLPYILPNPDMEVVAFLQRAEAPKDKSNVEAGKHCTVDFPNAKHYRTTEDFLADDNIDLVIICTSSQVHYDLAKATLEAGKHVVVEKPFTATSAEADSLIEISKKAGKILTVYQNRRYDSDFRTVKLLYSLDPNPFGKVTEFANYYDIDHPPWAMGWGAESKPADGMLYGLGTHSIDQTLQLFGQPASVTAFVRVLRDPSLPETGPDDTFTVILQYDRKGEHAQLVSTIKTTVISRLPLYKQPKFLVRGTHGSFVKEGEDVQVEHHFDGLKASDAAFGKEPERYHGYLHTLKPFDSASGAEKTSEKTAPEVQFSGKVTSQPGSYMDYYRDVVKAVRGEGPVVVKPEESRMGIRVIELAKQSAKEGRTVEWSER